MKQYNVYAAGPIFFEGDLYRCQAWKKKLDEAFGDKAYNAYYEGEMMFN